MMADINTVSNTDVLGNLNLRAGDWGKRIRILECKLSETSSRTPSRSQLNYRTIRGKSRGESSSREFERAESRMKETS